MPSDNPKRAANQNSEFTYCYHLVAFLDLVGQKELLHSIEGILNINQTPEDQTKLQIVLKQTLGTVWEFRNAFTRYFEQYVNQKPTIAVPNELRERFLELRSHSPINLQNFSDSTIAWIQIYPKSELECVQALNSIYGVLMAVGMLTPLFLSKGVPFRGGIDIEGAIPIYNDSNEIYGPALNCAYLLESKIAKYPRVVVGDGLLEYLDAISQMPIGDQWTRNWLSMQIVRCRDIIINDEDGLPMVHFLSPALAEVFANIPARATYYDDVLLPALNFIAASEKRFTGNKLEERYRRLRGYFEKYLPLWERIGSKT